MNISDKNYSILNQFFENAIHSEDPIFLWKISKKIEGSLAFRMTQVFVCFKFCFLKCLENWYLNQTLSVLHQYQIRVIKEAKDQVSDPHLNRLVRPLFNSSKSLLDGNFYANIRSMIQLNQEIKKQKTNLLESGYQLEEINLAIETIYQKVILNLNQPLNINLQTVCDNLSQTRIANREDWINKLSEESISLEQIEYFKNSPRFSLLFQGLQAYQQEDVQEIKKRLSYLDILEKIERTFSIKDASTQSALKQHFTFLRLYPTNLNSDHESALKQIHFVVDEIYSSNYPEETVDLVLNILLKMTSFGIRQETLEDYKELRLIAQRETEAVKQEQLNTWQRSIQVIKGEDNQNLAKLRYQTSQNGSKNAELASYEVDHLLGHHYVPPTIRLPSKGLIQKYISHSQTLHHFLENDPQAAETISQMDIPSMQVYLTLGLIRGRKDGHGDNTVIQFANTPYHFYDIDEEDSLGSINLGVISNADEFHAPKMAAFGFPQANQPYPKVLIKLFTWEGIRTNIFKHFRRKKNGKAIARTLRQNQLFALQERLNKLLTAFRFESQKDHPTLTPKDLFFFIYGKDFLYQEFKKAGAIDYEFFNDLIQEHDDKRYRPPTEARQASKSIYFQNIRKLDNALDVEALSMKSEEGEQYPGQGLLKRVDKALKSKQIPYNCLEINPKAFNQANWNDYKIFCQKFDLDKESFMLSLCLQGYAKRMARQLSDLYPNHSLDIVPDEAGRLFLQIAKQQNATK